MSEEPEILTIKEAAARLKISLRQVARLLATGELPSFCIGSRRLIRSATLAAFVQKLEESASRQAA